ncbi:MAG TPA: glycosyl transferase, partial [Roseiflexaceae bacterium]|nr:glycosyl transferase [Roseiflexaceae bacterium]
MPFFPDRATLEQYAERARARLLQFAPGRRMLTARPLRGLLLNTEQLEERVRALASEHRVVQSDGSMLLLQRTIDRNERLVNNAYRAFNGDARARLSITPAAEWLVDNIHVVTDQIREVRQDLPQGYYRKLPKLASGPYRGFPRIYGLALTIIEHTDGHLDQEQLVRCVVAYQAVAPLTMGEVWAVPIMLRLGLIDNIGRLANLTLDARELRVEADAWAERVLAERSTTSGEGHPILREIEQKYPQLLLPFVVQLLRRLRGHEGEVDVAALVAWIERQPALPYNTAEELIHAENQRQAANQVSVANTITSMRMLNAIDWETWFERVCLVEQVLRQDPNGTYARGTFATRDRYRHELEVLARGSGMSELDLARLVIEHAQQARREERAEAEGH